MPKHCDSLDRTPATGTRVIPFAAFTQFTPVIPKFYEDVYNVEEVKLHLFKTIHKIKCYLDYLAKEVDTLESLAEVDWEELLQKIREIEAVLDIIKRIEELAPNEKATIYTKFYWSAKYNSYIIINKVQRNTVKVVSRTRDDDYHDDVTGYVNATKPFFFFNLASSYTNDYISNGKEVIRDTDGRDRMGWLGFDSNGVPTYVEDLYRNIRVNDLTSYGFFIAAGVFNAVKLNGTLTDWSTYRQASTDIGYDPSLLTTPNPRKLFGWDETYFYTVDMIGRVPYALGADMDSIYDFCSNSDVPNWVNCGGGGDIQTWVSNPVQNMVMYHFPRQECDKAIPSPNNTRSIGLAIEFIPAECICYDKNGVPRNCPEGESNE